MKIAFYGGETAGIVTLLTLLGTSHSITHVFPQDQGVARIAKSFQIPVKNKLEINSPKVITELIKKVDLLICCHGKRILSKELVSRVKCINLHPCLYKYKGAKPVDRLIADGNPKASIASHWMVEKIDAGETIIEEFIDISEVTKKSPQEVYSLLYPVYVEVLLNTLQKIQ